jgi:hypothetical protein
MRTQLHLDPITRNQSHKIPFHSANYVRQDLLLVLQLQQPNGGRPLFDDDGLDYPGPRPLAPGPCFRHGLVSTHGPFSVTAMQCSK